MKATNDTADQFEAIIAAGRAAIDSFFRSVASGDWSNLIANMNTAIKAAPRYTKAMDELADRKLSMDVETADLKAQDVDARSDQKQ